MQQSAQDEMVPVDMACVRARFSRALERGGAPAVQRRKNQPKTNPASPSFRRRRAYSNERNSADAAFSQNLSRLCQCDCEQTRIALR